MYVWEKVTPPNRLVFWVRARHVLLALKKSLEHSCIIGRGKTQIFRISMKSLTHCANLLADMYTMVYPYIPYSYFLGCFYASLPPCILGLCWSMGKIKFLTTVVLVSKKIPKVDLSVSYFIYLFLQSRVIWSHHKPYWQES